MLKPLTLILSASTLLLAACDDRAPPTTAQVVRPVIDANHPVGLAGTSWRIATIGGTRVEDASATRISFTNDTVVGSFGCNQWTAPYEVAGNLLHVGMPSGSQYDCPGKTDFQERDGVRRIQMPMQVVQNGANTVTLSGREGQNFVLENAPQF